MISPVVANGMYVILGASGNTGSVIANSLLLKGEKVRVVGRNAGRLQRSVGEGAEAFTADISDAAALTKAFSGARAAYLMLPPAKSRHDQEQESAIAKAVHGHSDGPDPGQPAIEGYARDVATAIRALAPAAKTVIGMSAGGLTAIRLAAREPSLIGRLVLVDILPAPDPAAARAITEFLDGPATFDSFEEILERTVRYNPTRSVSSLRRGSCTTRMSVRTAPGRAADLGGTGAR